MTVFKCFLYDFSITCIFFSKIFAKELTSGTNTIQNCTCGLDISARQKIFGGTAAEELEFPWQVSIYYMTVPICSGTIINNKYVLSAAHCFKSYDFSKERFQIVKIHDVYIVMGQTNLVFNDDFFSESGAIKTPVYVMLHPLYDPFTLMHDVSLVKMDKVIEFSRNIHPICLPPVLFTYENMTGIVSGWGRINATSKPQEHLRKATVQVYQNERCQSLLNSAFRSDVMLCAKLKGKDSCRGDSGGPLIASFNKIQYIQVGIVSFGIAACGDTEKPGIYTRLTRFVPWIRTRTRDAIYCEI